LDDPLGQAFHNGGFSHARFANQHRIIFGAPRKHLHYAPYLFVAPYDRVQLAFSSLFRQIAGVTVWGPDFSPRRRAPTVSITLEGKPAEAVARRLGERGILAWNGDFYAARAVEVLGLADRGGLLRAGMALYTLAEDVDRLVEAVGEIARS
jgi:hypothetical protein